MVGLGLMALAEFAKAALQPLMDSQVLEGQQLPVEVFIDSQGRYVPTKGYRRLSAMRDAGADHRS